MLTKTQKYLVVIGFTLLGLGAIAAKERVDRYGGGYPLWFDKGIYVGPAVPDPTTTTDNKVTRMLAATKVYDFPALSGPGVALGTVCADTSSLTLTGVRFKDACSVGVDQVRVNSQGTLISYVSAANTVVIQACAVGITDGGSFDMPDASYTVRCSSNQ